MLYNSHPIADIVKASKRFRRRRKNIDCMKPSQLFLICYDCGENTDWIHMDVFCDKCRIDECVYCGRDLTDRDYDPNVRCIHCS